MRDKRDLFEEVLETERREGIRDVLFSDTHYEQGFTDEVEEGKMKEALGLNEDQDVSEFDGTPREATEMLIDEFGRGEAASMINFAANSNESDQFLQDMQDALSEIPKE